MKPPIGWGWPTLAGVAIALALVAGSSRPLAIGAATVAVIAAALAVVGALGLDRTEEPSEYEPIMGRPGGLREAFVGGELGRIDIVLACDLLERKLARPDLRARTPAEVDALVRVPPAEFRRYLARRLAELEAAS